MWLPPRKVLGLKKNRWNQCPGLHKHQPKYQRDFWPTHQMHTAACMCASRAARSRIICNIGFRLIWSMHAQVMRGCFVRYSLRLSKIYSYAHATNDDGWLMKQPFFWKYVCKPTIAGMHVWSSSRQALQIKKYFEFKCCEKEVDSFWLRHHHLYTILHVSIATPGHAAKTLSARKFVPNKNPAAIVKCKIRTT